MKLTIVFNDLRLDMSSCANSTDIGDSNGPLKENIKSPEDHEMVDSGKNATEKVRKSIRKHHRLKSVKSSDSTARSSSKGSCTCRLNVYLVFHVIYLLKII